MSNDTDKYIFQMLEKDFDKEIHELTGLWDVKGHPIVRWKYRVTYKNPIGFGRDKEHRYG